MTMVSKFIVSAVLFTSLPICAPPQALFFAAQEGRSEVTPQPAVPANEGRRGVHKSSSESEGDRIFKQNCSRCHEAPDGFSSHISGTVLRHMRVRAALSPHDEQELLRFLNP
jgi:hypothetical protein